MNIYSLSIMDSLWAIFAIIMISKLLIFYLVLLIL